MGNFGGETVIGTPGSSIPAAAVKEVLGLFADAREPLPPIHGVYAADICATSGGAATEFCPAVISEFFPIGVEIDQCRWHTGHHTPVAYPVEYQSWALDRGYVIADSLPQGMVDRSGTTTLAVVHPSDNAIFYLDPSVPTADQAIRIEAIADTGEQIQLWANDSYLGEGPSPVQVYLPLRPGNIRILAASGSNLAESNFTVK